MPSGRAAEEARYLAYSSGNFSKNILWGSADVTLMFVMTDLLGFDPKAAGLIFLFSLVWDAVLDNVIGVAADRARLPLGRYGPFILLGAPLCAVSFIALFAAPLADTNSITLFAVLLFTFRTFYAWIDLPHNALIIHVASDSRVRSRIAGYRFVFSSLASLVVALWLVPLASEGGAGVERRILVFAVVAATASAAVMFGAWFSFRRADRHAARSDQRKRSMATQFRALAGRRSVWVLLAAGGFSYLGVPLFAKTLLYFGTYVAHEPAAAARGLILMVAGQFCGAPLWMWASARWEKATALGWAHWTVLASAAIFALAAGRSDAAVLATCFVYGVGACGVYTVIWSMMADSMDEAQLLTGVPCEGLGFAGLIFIMKAAAGLGAAFLGVALDLAGFTPGVSQEAGVRLAITACTALAPAISAIACIGLLKGYRLTHHRHDRIRRCRTATWAASD